LPRFDTLAYSLERYQVLKPALGFRARTPAAAVSWQRRLRAKLVRLLGGFPAERGPLRAKIIARRVFPEYVREEIVFRSRPGMDVFAYLLCPRGPRLPRPCVVALHGHGRGVDPIVGYDAKRRLRRFGEWGEYHNDYALQCVAHGYVALAIEQAGFGRRRDRSARHQGPENSSCQPAAGAALLFGETMIAWRVWDVMRAIDYLGTRPEVDSRRIAVLGLSGGGTTSLFSAALDTRIRAAVVSGYFNTFRDSIMSLPHCIDNYVPGILKVAEQYDIAGLIAPRPLFVESGTRDPIFPVAATRYAFDRVRRVYRVFKATDRLGMEVFRNEHIFHGKGAFRFLKNNL
jgi:dienelactone hydrolase